MLIIHVIGSSDYIRKVWVTIARLAPSFLELLFPGVARDDHGSIPKTALHQIPAPTKKLVSDPYELISGMKLIRKNRANQKIMNTRQIGGGGPRQVLRNDSEAHLELFDLCFLGEEGVSGMDGNSRIKLQYKSHARTIFHRV